MRWFYDLIFLLGAALTIGGVAEIYQPAGFILAGIIAIVIAILGARQ